MTYFMLAEGKSAMDVLNKITAIYSIYIRNCKEKVIKYNISITILTSNSKF